MFVKSGGDFLNSIYRLLTLPSYRKMLVRGWVSFRGQFLRNSLFFEFMGWKREFHSCLALNFTIIKTLYPQFFLSVGTGARKRVRR